MTATSGAFPSPHSKGLLYRTAIMWGHYGPRFIPAFYLGMFAFNVAVMWGATPPAPVVVALYPLVTGMISAYLCEAFVHNRGLCLRCVEESPVLDPQGAVNKHMTALRLHHIGWLTLSMAGLAFVGVMLPVYVAADVATPLWAKLALMLAGIGGFVANVFILRVEKTHRRLEPWCPWCHPRRGGRDETLTPTPDPVRSNSV